MSRVCEAEGMVSVTECMTYETLVRKRERFMDRPFIRSVLHKARQAHSILDVGTGPGQMPIMLGLARPDLDVHGVDMSPSMLAVARREAIAAGVQDRVTFHQADAKDLPLESNSFDMVISHVMLHHSEDPTHILGEMMRVIRPGGRLILKDIVRTSDWSIPLTATVLGAFAGYTHEETRIYEESIRSAFSMDEIRHHVSRVPAMQNATVRRSMAFFYLIECEKNAASPSLATS